jgi:deleted-in-malignant-brain-tumors protein 1
VRCSGTTVTCTQAAIRLQGGSTSTEGRVEICSNNMWGTVCGDLWDNTDARVACAQLGLPGSGEFACSITDYVHGLHGMAAVLIDNVLLPK